MSAVLWLTVLAGLGAGVGSWLYLRHVRAEVARERAAELARHVRPFAEVLAALRPLQASMMLVPPAAIRCAVDLERMGAQMRAAMRASATVADLDALARRLGDVGRDGR